MEKILFCFLIVAISCAPQCPLPFNQQSAIFSDTVLFQAQTNGNLTNAQKLIYSYPFKQSMNSQPNIAIGLNQIVATSSPILQIQVTSPKITEKGVYFQAQSNSQSQWKNFKINFLASTRPDIQIGSATSINPRISNQNSFQLPYKIANNFDKNGIKIKSFLQSIDLESPKNDKIGIKEERSTFYGNNQIYITFSNLQRVSIIRLLTISIVIFNINTPGVLYADGIIDQNYVVSLTQITIPKHGINQLRTYLVGINSFLTSSTQDIAISSTIDSTFELRIGPINRNEIDFISVSYLILSIVDCGSCSGYPLLFDGICNEQCPTGTYRKGGKCISILCQEGYFLDKNGTCIKECSLNEYYDYGTSRCQCNPGYYPILNACRKCFEGFKYNYKTSLCEPICSINSYFNSFDKQCYCNPGYFIINSNCQKCPYGTLYEYQTQRCIEICSENQIYTPEGCTCQNNYYRIDGKCGRCPYQQIWYPQSKKCGCREGFQLVLGTCEPVCKDYEERIDYACVCQLGYFFIDGKCGKCPINSFYNQDFGRCECLSGYTDIRGKCIIVCPQDTYLDSTTNKCKPYCSQHAQVYINGQCLCHKDYQRLPSGLCVPKCGYFQYRTQSNQCDCYDQYFKNAYGQCRPINCPQGTQWNPYLEDCVSVCFGNQIYINNHCVCEQGFIMNSYNGFCARECYWHQQMNKYGICECQAGYKRNIHGICQLECAQGSHQVNGVCVCDQNCGSHQIYCKYGEIYDQILKKCKCPINKIWVLGYCRAVQNCGQREYWQGNQCSCSQGYYRINDQCIPVPPPAKCPPNSIFNGINCKCLDGFYPISDGRCQICSHDQFWNGKSCSFNKKQCIEGFYFDQTKQKCQKVGHRCKENEEWDGNRCRCQQGYFWIDSLCQKCSYGQIFDGIKCSAGAVSKCKDPYSFWNGQKCVCIPGYHPLKDAKCIDCPTNTFWNGQCCQAKYGTYIPWTVY